MDGEVDAAETGTALIADVVRELLSKGALPALKQARVAVSFFDRVLLRALYCLRRACQYAIQPWILRIPCDCKTGDSQLI
jgi:hypothetical protein